MGFEQDMTKMEVMYKEMEARDNDGGISINPYTAGGTGQGTLCVATNSLIPQAPPEDPQLGLPGKQLNQRTVYPACYKNWKDIHQFPCIALTSIPKYMVGMETPFTVQAVVKLILLGKARYGAEHKGSHNLDSIVVDMMMRRQLSHSSVVHPNFIDRKIAHDLEIYLLRIHVI